MMKIETGKGTIPLIMLIGIWSISALNALPGLAVSPILGKLDTIFPHATELDIQMLSSMPSLMVIPIILLSGKLTERVNNMMLLRLGLWIFAASGVLYLVSSKMWQLVWISALLGVGSGLIVPLSTGLISKYFVGIYRTKQYGLSSAVTNITLVVATTLTGYLAEVNWRLPFVVYLFPLISLVLSYFFSSAQHKNDSQQPPEQQVEEPASTAGYGRYGIALKPLVQLMLFYAVITYLAVVVSFNLPFLMQERGYDSGSSGVLISLFFLSIMAPGFILPQIVNRQKNRTKIISVTQIAIGLALILFFHSIELMGLGCIFIGWGYGVLQPLIYDQTSHIAVPHKVTFALSLVMSMNYVSILLCPFIVDSFQQLIQVKSNSFAFSLNLLASVALILICQYYHKSSFFNDKVEVA